MFIYTETDKLINVDDVSCFFINEGQEQPYALVAEMTHGSYYILKAFNDKASAKKALKSLAIDLFDIPQDDTVYM